MAEESFISKALGLLPIVGPIGSAITQGGPRRQYKWNKRAAEDANRMNRENQQWLLEQNKLLQAEQRSYDSPESQMDRYLAAGLNPNMIYGNGSSAGQAFPIDAGSVGSVNIQPPSAAYPDIASSFLRAGQISAQTRVLEAQEAKANMDTALKSVLVDIARSNPLLSPGVAEAVANSMLRTSELKAAEAAYTKHAWIDRDRDHSERIYVAKIRAEVEAMAQRIGLNTMDLDIKNKILVSKEFENAVKEIQKNWLQNGDVSPEHIRQGLMLILQKMMGK